MIQIKLKLMAKRRRRSQQPQNLQYLPQDCLLSILKKLPRHDFKSVSLVSKQLCSTSYSLVSDLRISDSEDHHRLLPQLLRRFTSVKSIDFDRTNHLATLDRSVVQIARSDLKNLEKLVLSRQISLPLAGIRELGFMKMTSLKILFCSNLEYLNDTDLSLIANCLPWLQELNISCSFVGGRREVTDKGIAELAAKLPALVRINMSGNVLISDQSIHCLLSSFDNIVEIGCLGCDGVTPKGLTDAIRSYSKSKSLILRSFDYVRTDLNRCYIEFNYGRILASSAPSNVRFKKLTIYFNGRCTDQYISSVLPFLGKFRTLRFFNCYYPTSAAFSMLVDSCPSLVELEMSGTYLEKGTSLVVGKQNNAIKILKLNCSPYVSDETMKRIVHVLPNLELLEVCDCPRVTKKGMEYVVNNCPEIKEGFGGLILKSG